MVAIDTNQNKITLESVMNLKNVLNGKNITIIGHDNIDVDSFLSGILFSKLLNFWNITNEFCIYEEVKEDDTYVTIKELFDIDMKVYQKHDKVIEKNLVLLDHYETIHEGKVLACIDHHPTNKQMNYDFKYVKNSCATAYLIYTLMKIAKYPISKDEINMIVSAMLIDTVSFRSSKTVKEEADEAKELATKYKIDFERAERYGMALTNISEMNDEEIISNGQKWYSFKRKNDVVSSYLMLYDLHSKETFNHWIDLIKKRLNDTGAVMSVFIVCDMQNVKTYEYQITSDATNLIVHSGIKSRGKDIMPKVEEKIMYM